MRRIIAGVLKDVPSSPHQMIKDPSQDHIRMSAYPNLEYGNLYNALAMLIDVAQNIQFGLNGESRLVHMTHLKPNDKIVFLFSCFINVLAAE